MSAFQNEQQNTFLATKAHRTQRNSLLFLCVQCCSAVILLSVLYLIVKFEVFGSSQIKERAIHVPYRAKIA